MSRSIDIGPATLERIRPDLVVVRFKSGSVANPAAFAVSMNARKEHFGDTPHGVVLIAPDDTDFTADLFRKDHYEDQRAEDFTRALALVSADPNMIKVLELYYRLHPAPFPVGFFAREEDAFPWVEEQMAKPTR